MFRLCFLNKYLSSAAAETALTRQNHRPVESAGRSFSIVTKPGCRNGAATWAECSGAQFGRVGCPGTVEMIRLAADRDWLHKATKEIAKYWRHKRERRMNPMTAVVTKN